MRAAVVGLDAGLASTLVDSTDVAHPSDFQFFVLRLAVRAQASGELLLTLQTLLVDGARVLVVLDERRLASIPVLFREVLPGVAVSALAPFELLAKLDSADGLS